MCGNYFVYISFFVECHSVYAYLAVEAVNRLGIVVAMIYYIVFAVDFEDRVMTWSVYGLVFIRGQYLSSIGERPHRPCG